MQDTQNTTCNKQRSSNIELFRIILMLLIIAYHYVGLSGLLDPGGVVYQNSLSWRSLFLLVCGAWGKVGIDCFVFITGYYMCRSQITLRKFLKLAGAWFFYNWVIYFTFILFHFESFSFNRIVELFFPFGPNYTGFVPCYVLFFLFIPFLNVLLRRLNEKQHIKLVILCCFIYVVIGSLPSSCIGVHYISLFITLYFISSYVRLYPKQIFSNEKFWKYCMFLTLLLSIASILGIYWIKAVLIGRADCPYFLVRDSNKPLAVLPAFSAFMYFKNMKLKHSSLINMIASSTFGVLLIHTNCPAMADWLWRDVFNGCNYYYSPYMPLHFLGSVFAVYFVCVLIDQIRIVLIEKPFFKFWDAHWNDVYARWERFEAKFWAISGIEVKKTN